MPPALAGTTTGAPSEPPLTGLTLPVWGALLYAALIVAFNVGLGFLSGSIAVQQALRSLVIAVGGAQLANRELFAAVVIGGITLLGYVVIIAPAIVLARLHRMRFTDAYGLRRFHLGQAVRLASAVVAGGIAVTVGWSLFLRSFGVTAPSNTVQLVQGFGTSPLALLIGYLLVGVIAPFGEEVAFRAVVFSSLRARWGLVAGVVVSGALFGIVHLIPLETVPLACIGMGLAGVFARSRSLWPSIIAHGCYNVVVLTIAFASVGILR
jgi:membrane protease YdiL (CAAX protease family)